MLQPDDLNALRTWIKILKLRASLDKGIEQQLRSKAGELRMRNSQECMDGH